MKSENNDSSLDSIRPKFFADFVGSQNVVSRVTKLIAKNLFPTVFLVLGPTGVGKTTLCRMIARALLCENRQQGDFEPCGVCRVCQTHFSDFSKIAEYEEIGGDQVKDTWFHLMDLDSLRHGWVVYVDELQDAPAKYNGSFRKILEGANAHFIFSTTHRSAIEDALYNRMKNYTIELPRPQPAEVVSFLEGKFHKNGITFNSRSQLVRIANQFDCEMRPIALFPQQVLAEADGKLTDEFMDEIWGPVGQGEHEGSSVSILTRPQI